MTIAEKCFEFIQSRVGTLVLMWEKENGWKQLSSECQIIANPKISEEGLDGLRRLVYEEDKPVFDMLCRELQTEMSGEAGSADCREDRTHLALRMQNSQGRYSYYHLECWFNRDTGSGICSMMLMLNLLDEDEAYHIKLAQKVTTDRNPAIFLSHAKEMLQANPDKKYVVIQFDVARFKVINEIYGEHRGDEMLDYFNESLSVLCRRDQLYSRLSADVFMIVTSYKTEDDIYEMIDMLDKNLLGFKGMNYRLVYGVCPVRDVTDGFRKYGDAAAVARQSIKESAIHHIAFFEDKMKESFYMAKFVEDNMNNALTNHEFVMYLQPKYSISRNKIVGAEALVRWIHPERGIISPMDFVPLFEQNGFILKMDQYIWEEACKAIRHWMDAGIPPIPISVNVSRRHLKEPDFVKVLNHLVDKYQIEKRYLEIEITETVKETEINVGVTLLKENGYTLLMDDFGSGYSSLNMLKDTKFDVIKMDRGFLQNFIGSDRGQRIVEHTIRMSRDIGLDMVAEGVETKEQAMFLETCGCDTAQGFYYAKPMPVEELNQMME